LSPSSASTSSELAPHNIADTVIHELGTTFACACGGNGALLSSSPSLRPPLRRGVLVSVARSRACAVNRACAVGAGTVGAAVISPHARGFTAVSLHVVPGPIWSDRLAHVNGKVFTATLQALTVSGEALTITLVVYPLSCCTSNGGTEVRLLGPSQLAQGGYARVHTGTTLLSSMADS
jgi:hypothetical protein